jgi:hypothetical protein
MFPIFFREKMSAFSLSGRSRTGWPVYGSCNLNVSYIFQGKKVRLFSFWEEPDGVASPWLKRAWQRSDNGVYSTQTVIYLYGQANKCIKAIFLIILYLF